MTVSMSAKSWFLSENIEFIQCLKGNCICSKSPAPPLLYNTLLE